MLFLSCVDETFQLDEDAEWVYFNKEIIAEQSEEYDCEYQIRLEDSLVLVKPTWNGKRISPADHTETSRLSLGHKFYLQSEIKRRLEEGEPVPMVERNINDYEIMYYQQKLRYGLKEVERENQFIFAQLEQLEIELKQIDIEIEKCYLISMKEAQLVGLKPVKGRWYPQGTLLMELEFWQPYS